VVVYLFPFFSFLRIPGILLLAEQGFSSPRPLSNGAVRRLFGFRGSFSFLKLSSVNSAPFLFSLFSFSLGAETGQSFSPA